MTPALAAARAKIEAEAQAAGWGVDPFCPGPAAVLTAALTAPALPAEGGLCPAEECPPLYSRRALLTLREDCGVVLWRVTASAPTGLLHTGPGIALSAPVFGGGAVGVTLADLERAMRHADDVATQGYPSRRHGGPMETEWSAHTLEDAPTDGGDCDGAP